MTELNEALEAAVIERKEVTITVDGVSFKTFINAATEDLSVDENFKPTQITTKITIVEKL